MNRNEFFQALPLTRITLRLTGATLEICPDDIDDIHVMISGDDRDAGALRITAAADQLTIDQPTAAVARNPLGSGWLQVTLRLPHSWKGSIDARTVSSRVGLRGLCGADLTLDTVSGMITADDVRFLALTARSITGDIKLSGLSCEKCSLSSTTGDLTLQQGALRTLRLNTVSGETTISLLSPFEEVSFNAVTSDLVLQAPIDACDAVLRSVSGRIRTSGVSIVEGAAKLRANTVSGDLEINRPGAAPTADEDHAS